MVDDALGMEKYTSKTDYFEAHKVEALFYN